MEHDVKCSVNDAWRVDNTDGESIKKMSGGVNDEVGGACAGGESCV